MIQSFDVAWEKPWKASLYTQAVKGVPEFKPYPPLQDNERIHSISVDLEVTEVPSFTLNFSVHIEGVYGSGKDGSLRDHTVSWFERDARFKQDEL